LATALMSQLNQSPSPQLVNMDYTDTSRKTFQLDPIEIDRLRKKLIEQSSTSIAKLSLTISNLDEKIQLVESGIQQNEPTDQIKKETKNLQYSNDIIVSIQKEKMNQTLENLMMKRSKAKLEMDDISNNFIAVYKQKMLDAASLLNINHAEFKRFLDSTFIGLQDSLIFGLASAVMDKLDKYTKTMAAHKEKKLEKKLRYQEKINKDNTIINLTVAEFQKLNLEINDLKKEVNNKKNFNKNHKYKKNFTSTENKKSFTSKNKTSNKKTNINNNNIKKNFQKSGGFQKNQTNLKGKGKGNSKEQQE
ncbi:hypothetical protein HDU92_009077, partial [Lobulomyces angularis]